MEFIVIGAVLAIAGLVAILARGRLSSSNERVGRKVGVGDRAERPLDNQAKSFGFGGLLLVVVGLVMVVVGLAR